MNGFVFNIQRFSTHDGPGVRTTVFLKGCPLRCFWCQNPESQSIRPVLMVNEKNCTACGRCVAICPSSASHRLECGQVAVDRTRCTACGRCADVCMNQVRSVAGTEMTPEQVMQIVLRDYPIYKNSGGGMTLSGGEVAAQPDFACQLLQLAKNAGIHTAIETCGYAPWPVMARLLENADYIMYDIKSVFPDKHLAGTGVSNQTIMENARKIARLRPVLIRMPLIPGFNDTPDDVGALAEFVRKELLLGAEDIELLAYNNLGEEKYVRMGAMGAMPLLQRQDDEYIDSLYQKIRSVFEGNR